MQLQIIQILFICSCLALATPADSAAATASGGASTEGRHTQPLPERSLQAPVRIMVRPGDSIVAKGFRGNFTYSVSESARDLSAIVTERRGTLLTADEQEPLADNFSDDWQFSFKREGALLQVFIEGPASKTTWREVLISKQIPQFDIMLVGPSVPLQVYWGEGTLKILNLNSDLRVTTQKAHIHVSGGRGRADISNQDGAIQVVGRAGVAKIDSYMAKVEIADHEGEVYLDNFGGESRLHKILGRLNLSSYSGQMRVDSLKGTLKFDKGELSARPAKLKLDERHLRSVYVRTASAGETRLK